MAMDIFVLGVIPARGGSQRIKQKNIAPFAGKPLLGWTVLAALESGIFTDVVVSTEDEAIARTAQEYGASVPFLRREFADDKSPSYLATCECVSRYEKIVPHRITYVVQLMATCPLRTAADIRNAFDAFLQTKAPAQISCARQMGLNSCWSVTLDANNLPTPFFPETFKKNSQDLPELYCPSGAIWIADKNVLLEKKTFYAPGHVFYPIPWISAFDIDTPEELDIAEKLMFGIQAHSLGCRNMRLNRVPGGS